MDNLIPDHQQFGKGGLPALRRRLFGPLLATLMMLRLVLLLAGLACLIPFRMDITFPEGALAARALDVARGESPYHDWHQWPHAFAPYPPLTYYSVGWIVRAVSAHPDAWTAYFAGRSFCFVMVLGIMALSYLFARGLGLSRLWSLVAVAALGGSLDIVAGAVDQMAYITSYRPDAPKTFFALLALWLALRRGGGRWTLAGVWASFYLSLWFKPTSWAIGLVLAAWTWRRLGTRRAAALGAGFVAAGLIPLWLLDRHWHGLLLLNIVDSLRNGFTFTEVSNLFLRAPLLFQSTLLAGVALALSALRDPARRGQWPLPAAVVLTFIISLAQMMKVGADTNYLIECYVLSTILVVAWIAQTWRGEERVNGKRENGIADCGLRIADSKAQNWIKEGILWVVIVLVLFFSFYNFSTVRDDFAKLTSSWDETGMERAARAAGGPILATNPFVALASPTPTILDDFQFSILCRRGLLDPGALLERLRRREFALVEISVVLVEATRRSGPAATPIYCTDFFPTLEPYYWRVKAPMGIYLIWLPRK